jgi:hypothetical protein
MPMIDGVSLLGLCAAIALPWGAGALAVRLTAGPGSAWASAAGYGFFIGQILVVGLLPAWNAIGASLVFWPAAAVLAALIAGLSTIGIRRNGWAFVRRPGSSRNSRSGLHWTAALAVLALLALIAARFALMAEELAARPLFPWDAWMNWVPRAIVWFHHLELTPFVAPPDWLAAPVGEEVYTLGNRRASDYPPGVPLLLLWTMLGAGSADHSLLYLPWLLAPIAFALLMWSALRAGGATPVVALIAVYLFTSLPLANVHTMLAGYADLWLALFFCAGAIALDTFQRTRTPAALLLAVAMAAGCMLMKTPGMIFGGLILGGAGLAGFGLPARWWRRIGIGGLVGVAVLLIAGLLFGNSDPDPNAWTLPLPATLPELSLQPRPLAPILFDSLLVSANWHLLWLVLPLAAVGALAALGRTSLDRPAFAILVAVAGLLVFVFGFTHYFRQAENLVTLNRTLLYPVPLAAYLIGAWLTDFGRRRDADD